MAKNWKRGLLFGVLAVALVGGTAASCETPQSKNSDKMMDARNEKVANIILCGDANDSLTCKNLKEFERRNSDPNRRTYVYLVNMHGEPFAYWVAKGRVSSTQAQMAPTDQVLDINPLPSEREWAIMEGPGDDGSSGPNEDGIFFFTEAGNHLIVIGGGEYILSDAPFALPGVKELKFA
jgi:hypothetical protein